MKEAIRKALGNGLFLNDYTEKVELAMYNDDVIWVCQDVAGFRVDIPQYFAIFFFKTKYSEGHKYMSIDDLISGTDFIEKLVGEGEYCKTWIEYHVENTPNYNPVCLEKECRPHSSIPGDSCFLSGWKMSKADFHREQMANIKDVEKLLQYIRTLN